MTVRVQCISGAMPVRRSLLYAFVPSSKSAGFGL